MTDAERAELKEFNAQWLKSTEPLPDAEYRRWVELQIKEREAPADTYRGWSISFDYGYFNAIGPNYDASWEGEEDGYVSNGEQVSARTREGVIEEIDAYIEDALARIETDRPRRETGSGRSMRAGIASNTATPSSQDTDQ